jgi:hypothetical protein
MFLVQKVIKSILGFLLILSLTGFILTNALYQSTSEEFIVSEIKSLLLSNTGFTNQLPVLQHSLREYFTLTNQTEKSVYIQDKLFTMTKEEAELPAEEFNSVLVDKVLGDFYTTKLKDTGMGEAEALGPYADLSMSDINMQIYSWMRISIILAILIVIAAFVLITGRFVFLGINLLIVGISYYPLKWSINKSIEMSLQNISGEEAEIMRAFMTGIFDKILALTYRWYLYAFILGIICLGLGILIKTMGWWQEPSFIKKKKK